MNDNLCALPLAEPPDVEPPPAELLDVLDDEQPAASASAMAAAPAAGTTENRFIPAPSRVNLSRLPVPDDTGGEPYERVMPGPLAPAGRACQPSEIPQKHVCSILQAPCHRCQGFL